MVDVSVIAGSAIRGIDGSRGRVVSVSLPWIRLKWDVPGDVVAREESILRSDPKLDTDIEILTMDRGWCPVGSIVGARERVESISQSIRDDMSFLEEESKKKRVSPHASKAKAASRARKANETAKSKKASLRASSLELLMRDRGGRMVGDSSVAPLSSHDERNRHKGEPGGPKVGGVASGHKEHYPFKTKDTLGPGPKGFIHRKADDWDCDGDGKYHQVCVGVKGGKYEGWVKDIWIPPGYKAEYNKIYKQWVKSGSPRMGPVGVTRFAPHGKVKVQTFKP